MRNNYYIIYPLTHGGTATKEQIEENKHSALTAYYDLRMQFPHNDYYIGLIDMSYLEVGNPEDDKTALIKEAVMLISGEFQGVVIIDSENVVGFQKVELEIARYKKMELLEYKNGEIFKYRGGV